ncbi:hypothetical protein [Natrinema longum]|uniref:hypothetical protein n=1 Tax=Natrinema longum TaxID=370324 RepID=UPI001CCBB655|nr:hypothetical protein [Natrinema longum]MBZ6494240.1 hypothetical protein [Natrinema longum]
MFGLAVVAIVAMGMGMGVGPVTAQEAPENPGNGATWGNQTAENAENTTYVTEVDQTLRVLEWRYDSEEEMVYIEFESDESKTVTVTEARQFEAGASKGRIKQKQIPEGTSKVKLPVKPTAGKAGVSITTPESIDNGSYTVLSTGIGESETPFHRTGSPSGWFGGAFTAVAMMGAAAYKVRNEEHGDVVTVE